MIARLAAALLLVGPPCALWAAVGFSHGRLYGSLRVALVVVASVALLVSVAVVSLAVGSSARRSSSRR